MAFLSKARRRATSAVGTNLQKVQRDIKLHSGLLILYVFPYKAHLTRSKKKKKKKTTKKSLMKCSPTLCFMHPPPPQYLG